MRNFENRVIEKIYKNMLNEKDASEKPWASYGDDWFTMEEKTPLDELQMEIYKQRLRNIKDYLDNHVLKPENPNEKIPLSNDEKKILLKYYFFCNDLKEMNFLGTDFFLRTRFVKQQVDYLYRALEKKDVEPKNKEVPLNLHATNIALKTYCQIAGQMGRTTTETKKALNKAGYDLGYSEMYSYSKSFLLAMYKYLILSDFGKEKNSASIEIREKVWVNCISKKENRADKASLQEYLWDIVVHDSREKKPLPYFCIDMSNACGDGTKQIAEWWLNIHPDLKEFGVSSVKDIEVLTNFTGENSILTEGKTKRLEYKEEELIQLLFWSFCMYSYKKDILKQFIKNLQLVLEQIKNDSAKETKKEFIEYIEKNWLQWDTLHKCFIELGNDRIEPAERSGIAEKVKLMADDPNKDWGEQEFLKELFSCIEWENEIQYLSRKQESMRQYDHDNVMRTPIGKWKYILYHTVVGTIKKGMFDDTDAANVQQDLIW